MASLSWFSELGSHGPVTEVMRTIFCLRPSRMNGATDVRFCSGLHGPTMRTAACGTERTRLVMSENDLFINQIGRLGAWLAEHVPHSPSAMWLRRMIDPISLWWSGKTLSMVNGASCRNYVIWRTAQPRKWHHKSASPRVNVSVQTACHELQTLGSAIKWYHAEHGPLAAVPKVTLPEQRGQKTDYWLTRKEVADRIRVARRNHFAKHIARVLLIGVYTGTRPGDVFALKWMPSTSSGYFDLEAGILHRRGHKG